jgi:hypothetical protein
VVDGNDAGRRDAARAKVAGPYFVRMHSPILASTGRPPSSTVDSALLDLLPCTTCRCCTFTKLELHLL